MRIGAGSVGLVFASLAALAVACSSGRSIEVERLPDLPDPVGWAGAFAGFSADRLLVAGGANFPDAPPWEGGTKVWHDRIVALDLAHTDEGWTDAGRLPRPNGYGVALTVREGVLLIGGSDASAHVAESWLMTLEQGRVELRPLPALPTPLAQMTGALVGRAVHVVGGIDQPQTTDASAAHWRLDLDDLSSGWRALPPLPAAGRILASAASIGDALYVVGGCSLAPDAAGAPQRTYLRDAWRFARGVWTRLADLPRAAAAAGSPLPTASGALFVVGGDDGSLVGTAPATHPAFTREVLRYNVGSDEWTVVGMLAEPAPVTLPVVPWRGGSVFVSGELRPGVRTSRVFVFRPDGRQ